MRYIDEVRPSSAENKIFPAFRNQTSGIHWLAALSPYVVQTRRNFELNSTDS